MSNIAPLGYRVPNLEDIADIIRSNDSTFSISLIDTNRLRYIDRLEIDALIENSNNLKKDPYNFSYSKSNKYWLSNKGDVGFSYYFSINNKYSKNGGFDTSFASNKNGFLVRCIEDANEIMLVKEDFDYFKLMQKSQFFDDFVCLLKNTAINHSQELRLHKFKSNNKLFNKKDSTNTYTFSGHLAFNNKSKNISHSFVKVNRENQIYPYDLISNLNYSIKQYGIYPRFNYKPIGARSDFEINFEIVGERCVKKINSTKSWKNDSINDTFIKSYKNVNYDLSFISINMQIPELGVSSIRSYKIVDHIKLGSSWNSLLSVIPGWGWASVNKNKELRKFANISLGLMATGLASYFYSRYEYNNYQNKNFDDKIYSRANLSNKVFFVAASLYVPLVIYDFTRTFIRGHKLHKLEIKTNDTINNLPNSIVYN